MKVAIIGLGGIAEKAYLPALGNRADLELRLVTRDRRRLDAFGDAYRVPADRRFESVGTLLAAGAEAAFVHVATVAHAEVVGQLLDAGVPTYVDKPLADTLAGSVALVEQAERTGTPLMVGFNRRYVPSYVEAARGARDVVLLQKDEADAPGGVRDVVFDDFIHVADMLRFLAPGDVRDVAVSGRVVGGALEHVGVTLAGDGFTLMGVMNRRAGVKRERLQVAGGGRNVEVVDLGTAAGGWTPVARVRGIEQVCQRFLDAVRGEADFPDLRDALATHELCERVVAALRG